MHFFKPKGSLTGFYIETRGETPHLSHGGEQWALSNFFVDKHKHTVWELYLQLEGSSNWTCRGETYDLQANSFLAIPPHAEHSMSRKSSERHHFVYAGIDITSLLQDSEMKSHWNSNSVAHIDNASSMIAPFRQLVRELTSKRSFQLEAIQASLNLIIIEATRLQGNHSKRYHYLHPSVIHARELLDKSPETKWRVDDLARIVGVSSPHLSELFQNQMGISPYQYMLKQRIEKAKLLLAQSELPVTDLGVDLGFSSSQHFASIFKKFTDLSPGKFRKNAQGTPKKIARHPTP